MASTCILGPEFEQRLKNQPTMFKNWTFLAIITKTSLTFQTASSVKCTNKKTTHLLCLQKSSRLISLQKQLCLEIILRRLVIMTDEDDQK